MLNYRKFFKDIDPSEFETEEFNLLPFKSCFGT